MCEVATFVSLSNGAIRYGLIGQYDFATWPLSPVEHTARMKYGEKPLEFEKRKTQWQRKRK